LLLICYLMFVIYYLILALRFLFAPLILIWPVNTVIVSFFLDVIDGDFAPFSVSQKKYQELDKIFDYWVYIFEMAYAWIHLSDYKILLLALLVWRTIGHIIFHFRQNRSIFLIFGNYFENVFFLVFFADHFSSLKFILEERGVFAFSLAAVLIIKVFNEWFTHIAQLSIRENIFKSKRRWIKK